MTKDEQIKLIEENEKLVYSIINTYYPTLAKDDDAKQIGLIGLWKATTLYNPERGKFTTYAGVAIRRHLTAYMTSIARGFNITMSSLTIEDDDDEVDSGILTPAPLRPIWVGPPLNTLLTARQMMILRMRKDEWDYRSIAAQVGVSRTTVMNEMHTIKSIINDNILYI